MKKRIVYLLIFSALGACSSGNEDKVNEIIKDGSIEEIISINHIDNGSYDVLTTVSNVYNHGSVSYSYVHHDTLPSLGMVKEEGEDGDGNVQTIEVPKDYELYITVK